jgi:NAD(P)-dependent dehydrogenase (short-subunit alcohol dehydrogenase family)
VHLQLTAMRLDQGSERLPVTGARPPEQFRRHVTTSIFIVPSVPYRHRPPKELVAAGSPSFRRAPVSAQMTASTRRRPRQNGERSTMSISSATGIANGTVLVTGANRGIGRALVEEALARGAKRVYASTRQPITHPDRRVVPLMFDLTDAAQIRAAAGTVDSLDILVNNAGLALYDDLGDPSAIERHLAVNLFGPLAVTQAFLPLLTRSRGAIVNVLSTAALAAIPIIPAYSISKAAAFSMSQSLRALLAGRGVQVHAVMTGPTDTDMSRGLDIPKASPESVARAIFDGVQRGDQEIFPDPMSASLELDWNDGAVKAMERQNEGLVTAEPVAS